MGWNTEHFIKVFVKSDDNLKNKSLRVKLFNAMTERGIQGELVWVARSLLKLTVVK